jgi:hypothetical protein
MLNLIKNMPESAKTKKCIVVRRVNGELWYWGAWDDADTANEVALEIGGMTIRTEE